MSATFTRDELARMGFDVKNGEAVRVIPVSKEPAPPKLPGRFKSSWEVAYAAQLGTLAIAGAIEWWGYEAVKLRLANGAWYTPDFAVRIDGQLQVHEVKGRWREAARVRVKVMAEQFPWLPLFILTYERGLFRVTERFN